MIKRVKGSEKEQAREVIEKIVNAISEGNYGIIEGLVDNMNSWTTEFIHEIIESYKEDNEIVFDKYGTPCSFNPIYMDKSVYQQEKFYYWINAEGFGYVYDFTSNGDLNDLSLLVDFHYKGNEMEVSLSDLHVL